MSGRMLLYLKPSLFYSGVAQTWDSLPENSAKECITFIGNLVSTSEGGRRRKKKLHLLKDTERVKKKSTC